MNLLWPDLQARKLSEDRRTPRRWRDSGRAVPNSGSYSAFGLRVLDLRGEAPLPGATCNAGRLAASKLDLLA